MIHTFNLDLFLSLIIKQKTQFTSLKTSFMSQAKQPNIILYIKSNDWDCFELSN